MEKVLLFVAKAVAKSAAQGLDLLRTGNGATGRSDALPVTPQGFPFVKDTKRRI